MERNSLKLRELCINQTVEAKLGIAFNFDEVRHACNTLHHTATYCNILQRTATQSGALQYGMVKKKESDLLSTLMRCDMSAAHGNTQQHTATHSNTQQHTATHCNVLQHTATQSCREAKIRFKLTIGEVRYTTRCNMLQHTAIHCIRYATHCNTLQHAATHCSALQCTATHRTKLQNAYC